MRIIDRKRKYGNKGDLKKYPIKVPVPAKLAKQMAADRYRYVRDRRRAWLSLMQKADVYNPFKQRVKAVKRVAQKMKDMVLLNLLAKAGWLK